MTDRHSGRYLRRSLILALTLSIGAAWLAASAVAIDRPGEFGKLSRLSKLDNALGLIPEDAAFFSTMLRNREQWAAVTDSRAWAKVKQMPVVQMSMMFYTMQAANPESPVGQFNAMIADPQGRKIVDLLVDMVSDEVFFYGDESFVDFTKFAQELNNTNRFAPLAALAADRTDPLAIERVRMQKLMRTLVDNLERVTVPNLVVGFKLDDVGRATEPLKALEQLIVGALGEQAQRVATKEIGGHKYLVLTLDGEMIPWKEMPIEEFEKLESKEGDAKKVIQRMKQQKLVIALGTRDNYVLLSIGSSTDALERLGTGKRLIDRPELKPLVNFTDKRLISIGYVGAEMNRQLSDVGAQIDGMIEAVDEMLPAAGLSDEQVAEIRKDAAQAAKDLKGLVPVVGPVSSFSFMTDQGIESYGYNWGKNFWLDGSKPLGLLQHVGGAPALAVVSRSKHNPKNYELIANWAKIGYRYFRQYALPEMDEDERQKAEKFLKLFIPLVKRADKVNREMLVPALADGQTAVVVDTELKSKQFHESWPVTDEPMPMVEPALVLGVSDAELLRKGWAEYQAILDDLVDVVRQMDPESVPADYKIPRPKKTETKDGTICTYRLPKAWGLDEKITPTLGLSESVAVVATSREHAQRLLQATPVTSGGVLSDAKRPLAVAGVFDWEKLVDAATPWVELALAKAEEESVGGNAAMTTQVLTVLEVLKVIRTITSTSYFEDGALVSHTLVEIRDIEEE